MRNRLLVLAHYFYYIARAHLLEYGQTSQFQVYIQDSD